MKLSHENTSLVIKLEEEKAKAQNKLDEEIKSGKKSVVVFDTNKLPKTITYFKGWQMTFEYIAVNYNLKQTDYKVLMLILARLDYDNYINIKQQNMADILDINIRQVTRSIVKLVKNEIIIKKKIGRQNFYMLNPCVAWKGKPESFKQAIDIKDFNMKNKEYQNNKNNRITKDECPF